MRNDYLINWKPLKALTFFALPMILGNLFQQLYIMIDSAIVGRYVSEQALAAVGASYALTNIFICIAIGGGIGASVTVSRYFGAGESDRLKVAVRTALLAFLGVSIVLGAVGLLFCDPIMVLLKTPADVLDMAETYLKIYFCGLPFLFMYNVLSSMFNALGKSVIPLLFLIFSSLLNIGLDIFMVNGLELGVAGVAWATLIAQGLSAVLSFFVFQRLLKSIQVPQRKEAPGEATGFKNGKLPLRKPSAEAAELENGEPPEKVKTRYFDTVELAAMTRIALPSILQQSIVSVGMLLVQSVVNGFGSEALAGFSAAMRIESICIVPMAGIGNALSSYTAQNIGAGKENRVVKGYHVANGMVVFCAVIICLVLEIFHRNLIAFFLGEDGAAVAMTTGEEYLKFMGWFFCLIGFKMAVDGLLRGAGDMKPFTAANLANLTLRVVIAVTMAPRLGICMVWCAVPVGWFVNWLISYLAYRAGRWRKI